jgi:opacity protein-like surface antigen
MFHQTTIRRRSLAALFAAFFLFAGTRPAHAQGFISPLFGYNFGGDAGCPEITDCTDKRADYGISFGALGSIVGFEAELGYTRNFFGETLNQSNVLTFMSNFMLAPKIGPVQPYGLAGIGLIRTSVENVGVSNDDQNQFGWDLGGGLMVFFGEHVGLRGDVRYYHSLQVLDFLDLQDRLGFGGQKLDYGRAAAGMVFKF